MGEFLNCCLPQIPHLESGTNNIAYVAALFWELNKSMYIKCLEHSVQFSSVTQSCPTLCDPIEYSPPGSSVHGIYQARKLEWVAPVPLLQGIFLTWGSDSCLLHCRWFLYFLSPWDLFPWRSERRRSTWNACVQECSIRKIFKLAFSSSLDQFSSIFLKQ